MRPSIAAVLLFPVGDEASAHAEGMPELLHVLAHGWWTLAAFVLGVMLLPALRRRRSAL